MYYKTASIEITKKQQRAAIAWIITFYNKHFFCRDKKFLAQFSLTNEKIRTRNPLIYHSEVTIDVYGEEYLTTSGHKCKSYKDDYPRKIAASTRR